MELNKERIFKILNERQKEPFHEYRMIIEGFDVHVYYDNVKNVFWGTFLFSPTWPHLHGLYGKNKEMFFNCLVREIEDAKKTFTNGGKYPSDFYKHH